jgi:phosphatidylinositol alpha-1,6-mannosyltransferase
MTQALRILALVTDAFGGYGGIAQYNRDLLQACSASDCVESIVVMPRLVTEAISGPLPDKVIQTPAHFGRFAFSLAALRIALTRGPFDVIFCGHIYHAPLAAALCRLTGARLWLQTHGVDSWERPPPLLRACVEHATLVTTVSRYTRDRMAQWSRLAPEQIRVLPNTVRPMFSPGPPDPALLDRLGLSGRKIILTVSRLGKADAYKGHDRVIRALAQVRRAEPSAHYVIVGDGDGRRDLEALVAAQGQGEAVTFLGRRSDEDVLALYHSSAVFVMPSLKEGFGIVFIEAAACGLPVIAGNRDGSVDALADGALGQLIDPLSEAELVAALLDTLPRQQPPFDHAARADLSARAIERFGPPRFAQAVSGLMRSP